VEIIQKPNFRRAYKKLKPKEKEMVDEAIQAIIKNPNVGQLKKGDLSSFSVYKFKMNKQEKLLAYVSNKTQLLLASLGTHENLYRDLKKILH
jgi:hypothetical protein